MALRPGTTPALLATKLMCIFPVAGTFCRECPTTAATGIFYVPFCEDVPPSGVSWAYGWYGFEPFVKAVRVGGRVSCPSRHAIIVL
jgi:hypothetical protein